MGVVNALYMDSNYIYGVVDHANGMKSSVPWAAAGIATDLGGIMQTVATLAGSAKAAAAASTPIINGGLIALTLASNTLGFGRPEDGERFGNGSKQFMDAQASLLKSVPPEGWQGDASDAYGDRNKEQQVRTADMSSKDEAIQKVLATEAGQVENARDFVSKRQTALAMCIAPAIALNAIPVVGPGYSLLFQMASVLATVPFAMDRMEDMLSHASNNAGEIERIASEYAPITAAEMPGGGFGTP